MEEHFAKLDINNGSIEKLSKGKWNSPMWLRFYHKYRADRDFQSIKALRILVTETTTAVCERRSYKLRDGSVVQLGSKEEIDNAVLRNRYFTEFNSTPPIVSEDKTVVEVIEGDCIEAALNLKLNEKLNPAVLNMASAKRPGGGYRNGAGAQEENLFRRTNYYQHLEHPQQARRYRIGDFDGIYSPDVLVFRSSEATGYEFLPSCVKLAFIAVAAYARPRLVKGARNEQELTSNMADGTKRKIKTILNIALANGHDSVVLSAFGCGAYANPPLHIAKLFHEVINKFYRGAFKKIVFAIIDDDNARKSHNPNGNFLPFKQIFPENVSASNGASVPAADKPPAEPPSKEERKDIT
eukprot:TRINITY_DN1492_c1_g1_i2.p1 TRINITY_DN1492_c1_g1~~TRINITY_DN1492_c1_g1_i2.p1  ORF type:complete len:353 (-),score=67.85 TRINITY_DN1492_c1_g1_i2:155-1213(-)